MSHFFAGFEKRAAEEKPKASLAKKLLAGGAVVGGTGLALYGGHKALAKTEWARRGASGAGLGAKLKGALYGHADAKPTMAHSWLQNRTNEGEDFVHDHLSRETHTGRGRAFVENADPHQTTGRDLLRHKGTWQSYGRGNTDLVDVVGRRRGHVTVTKWDKRPARNTIAAHDETVNRAMPEVMKDR